MNPFIGLLKKEMLISRFWYITFLVIIFIMMVAGALLVNRTGEPSLVLPMFALFIPLQMFFIPITVYSLLRKEGRTQLWLYNPQSSVKLLLAKITSAIFFQIIFQFLFFFMGSLLLKLTLNEHLANILPMKTLILLNTAFISIGLYSTMWIIFLWTVYHSLGKYPSWKNFSWLAVVLIVITYNTLEYLLFKIGFIRDRIFQMTKIVDLSIGTTYEHGSGWSIVYEPVPVPIIPTIFYAILSLILFLISSKLLDQKVEV